MSDNFLGREFVWDIMNEEFRESDIANVHDHFFKEVFSRKEIAAMQDEEQGRS